MTDPGYPDPFLPTGSKTELPGIVQLAPNVQLHRRSSSASVERQVAKTTVASVTYTGTRGYHQFLSRDINAPPPPLYVDRPDPTYGVVREIESTGKLVGQSLRFTLRGQLTRYLNTSAQYTLSQTKNDTSGINWMPPNAYDLSLEYGRGLRSAAPPRPLRTESGPWLNFASRCRYSGRPYSMTTVTTPTPALLTPAHRVSPHILNGPAYADPDVRWSHEPFLDQARKGSAPTLTRGPMRSTY